MMLHSVPLRLRLGIAASTLALLCGCAVPATEVAVTTMPMREALDRVRAESGANPDRASALAPPPASMPAGTPQGLISAPDVRLAFLYEWIDAEGNRHFGEWVAIPVTGFDWVMDDGSRAPIYPAGRTPGMIGEGQ